MTRTQNQALVACVLCIAGWLAAAPAKAGDIFVYQSADGSRLITDHPRVEPGYRLIKVYAESDAWKRSSRAPAPRVRPRASAYDDLIRRMASRYSLDPMLIKSVMHAESAFDPNAVSHKGASGLMQLMPATARRYGVRRVFDPRDNVRGGVRYLSYLLDRFDGDLELVLAGYNAGENAVDRQGGIPPYPETRHYVRKVLALYREYRSQHCRRNAGSVDGTIISCSAPAGGTGSLGSLDVSSTPAVSSADDQGWRLE